MGGRRYKQEPKYTKTGRLKTVFRERDYYKEPEVYKGTQAYRIFRKFGGVPNLVKALHDLGYDVAKTTVYRCDYPVEKRGQGGLIPNKWIRPIVQAARNEGIFLTPEDLDPRPNA